MELTVDTDALLCALPLNQITGDDAVFCYRPAGLAALTSAVPVTAAGLYSMAVGDLLHDGRVWPVDAIARAGLAGRIHLPTPAVDGLPLEQCRESLAALTLLALDMGATVLRVGDRAHYLVAGVDYADPLWPVMEVLRACAPWDRACLPTITRVDYTP